jgi:hypothetical protein
LFVLLVVAALSVFAAALSFVVFRSALIVVRCGCFCFQKRNNKRRCT